MEKEVKNETTLHRALRLHCEAYLLRAHALLMHLHAPSIGSRAMHLYALCKQLRAWWLHARGYSLQAKAWCEKFSGTGKSGNSTPQEFQDSTVQ